MVPCVSLVARSSPVSLIRLTPALQDREKGNAVGAAKTRNRPLRLFGGRCRECVELFHSHAQFEAAGFPLAIHWASEPNRRRRHWPHLNSTFHPTFRQVVVFE